MAVGNTISTTTIKHLPEDLLIRILSHLPTLDAVSTSMVAPSWRDLRRQVPGFHFDILPFYAKHSSQPLVDARASFADCIERALSLPTPHRLSYFHLAFHYADYGKRKIQVRSWIGSAVARGVSKLKIHFYDDHWMEELELVDLEDSEPGIENMGMEELELVESEALVHRLVNMHKTFDFYFSRNIINSSVQEVELRNCGIRFPSVVSGRFESLKTLVLHDVLFTHNYQIQCLMSVCVNLEILHLEMIRNSWVDEFRIHLKRLKKLTMKGLSGVHGFDPTGSNLDIDTPELISLTMENFGTEFFLKFNMPSLVEADFAMVSGCVGTWELWEDFIVAFQNVERLRIHNMSPFPWDDPRGRFTNLKNLELMSGYSEAELLGISAILEASPMLESMIIIDCDEYTSSNLEIISWEMVENAFVELKIPRLRQFTIKNYRNTKNELYLVDKIKANKVMLERIVAIGEAPSSSPTVLWEAKQLTMAL